MKANEPEPIPVPVVVEPVPVPIAPEEPVPVEPIPVEPVPIPVEHVEPVVAVVPAEPVVLPEPVFPDHKCHLSDDLVANVEILENECDFEHLRRIWVTLPAGTAPTYETFGLAIFSELKLLFTE